MYFKNDTDLYRVIGTNIKHYRVQAKEEILLAFDKIFYGEKPLDAIKALTHIHFTQ